MTSVKKLLLTLIFGIPAITYNCTNCYALFIKDPKTGMVKSNPQLKVPCNCPCTTERLSDTTCLICHHKVGTSIDNNERPAVDLITTQTSR